MEGRPSRSHPPRTPRSAERIFAVPPQHFYRTAALPCPYLRGRIERKLVTELTGRNAAEFYNALSRAGFRRSHNLAYRPACAGCSACLPVRIPVAQFALSRSLKRIRNLNRDLTARVAAPAVTVEQYRLFLRYQRLRHTDSDMAAMTYGDYRAMVEDSPVATGLVELRETEGGLRGACLVDVLDDGLSAVYSFYDPENGNRSLGNLLVLALIDEAQRARPAIRLSRLSHRRRARRWRTRRASGRSRPWSRGAGAGSSDEFAPQLPTRPLPTRKPISNGVRDNDVLHVRLPLRHQGASEERRLRYIEGNRDHPVNRGVLCAKGAAGIMKLPPRRGCASPSSASARAAAANSARSSGRRRSPRDRDGWARSARRSERLAIFTGRDQSQALTSYWASQFGTTNRRPWRVLHGKHGGCRLYPIGGAFWEFGEPDWELSKYFMMFGVAEDHDQIPSSSASTTEARAASRSSQSIRCGPVIPRSPMSASDPPRHGRALRLALVQGWCAQTGSTGLSRALHQCALARIARGRTPTMGYSPATPKAGRSSAIAPHLPRASGAPDPASRARQSRASRRTNRLPRPFLSSPIGISRRTCARGSGGNLGIPPTAIRRIAREFAQIAFTSQ